MLMHALKTLMIYLLAFFFIILLSYLALQALPGDPILRLFADYGITESSIQYQQLQQMYDQDHGGFSGFIRYCRLLLSGEMGFSISYSAPVTEVIKTVLPWTWLLTVVTAPIALALSYLLGIEAAMHHGKWIDAVILSTNNFINAVPSFVKAVVVFFILLQLFPSLPLQGSQTPLSTYQGLQKITDIASHLIAPVLVLVMLEAGKVLLPFRAGALSVSSKPYVISAKLRGLSGWRIRHAYIGSNMRGIVIVRGAMMLVSLLSGSIFVEVVFSYPGVGLALFQGIGYRDYALIQGIILLLCCQILLLHFIADVWVQIINRRGA